SCERTLWTNFIECPPREPIGRCGKLHRMPLIPHEERGAARGWAGSRDNAAAAQPARPPPHADSAQISLPIKWSTEQRPPPRKKIAVTSRSHSSAYSTPRLVQK